MMSEHTVSAYDQDLNWLRSKIAEMGGMAEQIIEQAVVAICNNDQAIAKSVIADDKALDAAQHELNERVVLIIAKRQPVAMDLYMIMSVMRISADLERIGDLGKSIARRVLVINDLFHPKSLLSGIDNLSKLALKQVSAVLDAFATQDVNKAKKVFLDDEKVNDLYTSVFRENLTYMMEDPRNITLCTHMLFCAKNIERIGDHATNIAENIHYLKTGELFDEDFIKTGDSGNNVLREIVEENE